MPLSGTVLTLLYVGSDLIWSTCIKKFEVSMFSHYEDMKGNTKCRNLSSFGFKGHPRWPAMTPFDGVHTTSYSTLIETMCLSCTIFEILDSELLGSCTVSVRALCNGRRVVAFLNCIKSHKLSESGTKCCHLYRKSGLPSKNMTSGSAPEMDLVLVSQHQKGKTRKVKQICIYWSKR